MPAATLILFPKRKEAEVRLQLESRVDCADETFGKLVDVVIDPTSRRVTHLVVEHDVSYLRFDGFPVDDPDRDVGIEEVLALPYYYAYDLEAEAIDYAVTYDRIPKREVEIRRASAVDSADGHQLGHVHGFLVGGEEVITHLVLELGHPWERREVAVPIGAVARVENDAVTLRLSKDEVAALPPVAVRRRPRPGEHATPRR